MNVVMTGDGRFVEVQGTAEGARVHARRARRAARRWPSAASPRSSRAAGDGRRAADARSTLRSRRCRSSSRPPTPTRRDGDPRRSSRDAGVDVELARDARPTVPDVDETGDDARGERAHQGRRAVRRHRAAGDRRRHRARGRRARRRAGRVLGPLRGRARDLRRQRRQAARASSRDVPGPQRTARFAHRRAGALARRRGGRGPRRGRGRDRGARPRATTDSATTRCSCRSRATAARLRR